MPDRLLAELSRYQPGTWADIIVRNALLHGDVDALVSGRSRITFAAYNARVNRLVHALHALGVGEGEVIGLLSWNSIESFDVLGAAMKGGFIFSPYSPRLRPADLEHLIAYSEARVLFVGPELGGPVEEIRARLTGLTHVVALERSRPGWLLHDDLLAAQPDTEPGVDVREEDPVYIIYTSGTTGVPRGALYTHARAMHNIQARVAETPVQVGDRSVLTLQLFHVAGMESAQTFLYTGATDVILKTFEPRLLLETIQEHRITDVQVVPTTLAALFNLPDFADYDLSSLRRIVYAASPMPVALLQKGMDLWGPIFCQFYGQTESGPMITTLSRDEHGVAYGSPEEQRILLSVGRPVPGAQVRIVDEHGVDLPAGQVGEIIARGKHLMVEYWRRPEETATVLGPDGWLHTRDMAYADERGYIYIVGRKGDMIISGGENVMPREIEEVLYRHPAVNEAAVFGLPDPYWVERVHAMVVLQEGRSATTEELVAYCRDELAGFKVPKSLEIVDSLPKNASGKIDKLELKRRHEEEPPES